MNPEPRITLPETRVYAVTRQMKSNKSYKGKRPDLKCTHCHNLGHTIGRCWILHPELKPNFENEKGLQKGYGYKAHIAARSTDDSSPSNVVNFSTNLSALLNDFANYLKEKGDASLTASSNSDSTSILGKFAGFLANSDHLSQENLEGILTAFKTTLVASTVHNFWVIDSGAFDHITNKMTSLHHFEKITTPTHISVANGKHVPVEGKGKIKLLSENIKSLVLYVPSFPFQLLSIGKVTKTLNCRVILILTEFFFRTAPPRG